MRHALIRVNEIPENGAVAAELLGREVLVMMVNGKPRAFANVCMHHGGPLTLDVTRSPANGTAPSTTHAPAV